MVVIGRHRVRSFRNLPSAESFRKLASGDDSMSVIGRVFVDIFQSDSNKLVRQSGSCTESVET
jgi:hypothetical protein